jgi:hypothetical protein
MVKEIFEKWHLWLVMLQKQRLLSSTARIIVAVDVNEWLAGVICLSFLQIEQDEDDNTTDGG